MMQYQEINNNWIINQSTVVTLSLIQFYFQQINLKMGIGCSNDISQEKIDIKIQLERHQKQTWYKTVRYIIANHPDFQNPKKLYSKLQCSDLLFQFAESKDQKLANMIQQCYLGLDYGKFKQSNQINEVSYILNNDDDASQVKTVFSKAYNNISRNQQNFEIEIVCYHHLIKNVLQIKMSELTALTQIIMKFKSIFIVQFTAKLNKSSKQNKNQIRKRIRRSLLGITKLIRQCIRYLYQMKKNSLCINIMTKQNLDHFIISTLFSDQQIYDIVYKVYQFQLKQNMKRFLDDSKFDTPASFSLDINTMQLYFKNKQNQLQIQQTTYTSYIRTIQLIDSIINEKVPIKKLQIMYKIIIQIEQDVNAFYKKYDIQRTERLNKTNLQKIIQILIKICDNTDILVNISMTRDYIGKMYKHKKGGFINLFLDVIGQKNNFQS